MNTQLRNLIVLLLMTAFARPGSAATADSSFRFSAKEAIDYAFEHQKNVLNANMDARISEAQVREITGIGLPQVNGSVDLKDFFELGGEFYHGMTYAGHPVACAVALKNIEIIEQEKLVQHTAEIGPYFAQALASLDPQAACDALIATTLERGAGGQEPGRPAIAEEQGQLEEHHRAQPGARRTAVDRKQALAHQRLHHEREH